MTGTVTDDGVLIIMLPVAGQMWPGIIDTGFNGDSTCAGSSVAMQQV
jgi:hypothetical protein